MRQLPAESALSRALNGNEQPWGRTDHLIADMWALWAKKDHPVRAAMEAKRVAAAQQARLAELKAVWDNRKRKRTSNAMEGDSR